jgi:ubiquinone/menaquinone biosynthesis C-methylase UbiE
LDTSPNVICKSWYDQSYGDYGFAAQRRYPNEELLRFFGRHFFSLPFLRRKAIRVLETGCGSGANLWMIAREGFDAHGIDLSFAGIKLCEQMLSQWQTSATLKVADMTAIPYSDSSFHAVVDVFSSYCLNESGLGNFSR